jgi:hypothetical protein
VGYMWATYGSAARPLGTEGAPEPMTRPESMAVI